MTGRRITYTTCYACGAPHRGTHTCPTRHPNWRGTHGPHQNTTGPHTINGVNVPGQWLTPEYVLAHRIDGPTRLNEPRIQTCGACGHKSLLTAGPHECHAGVDYEAISAALPWRKPRAEGRRLTSNKRSITMRAAQKSAAPAGNQGLTKTTVRSCDG